jgi:hypothetical protein
MRGDNCKPVWKGGWGWALEAVEADNPTSIANFLKLENKK